MTTKNEPENRNVAESQTDDSTSSTVEPAPDQNPKTPFNHEKRFIELEKEILKRGHIYIQLWLAGMAVLITVFTVIIAVVGFFSYNELENIKKEAKKELKEIKETNKESQNIVSNITAKQVDEASPTEFEEIKKYAEILPPNSLIGQYAHAQTLQLQGRIKDALAKFEAVAILAETNNYILAANAWFSVGYLQQKDKLSKESITSYTKAIKLRPKFGNAYNNRGHVKSTLGKKEDAIKDYDEAIKINPQDAEAYYNRGTAKYALGKKEDAIKNYDEAIKDLEQAKKLSQEQRNAKLMEMIIAKLKKWGNTPSD